MNRPNELFVTHPQQVLQSLEALGPVDLIVGIPSFQEADNIAHVVRQADAGLREYFGSLKSVIINVDNNSPDGTRDAFQSTNSRTPLQYISTPKGARGKGNNFWNLFHAARILEARAIVAVDADLVSITPQWIRNLAQPLLDEGYDYVTPLYARNEYDGTITNNICFPLLYGLLGKNLRQPIGGDFGLSTRLSNSLLKTDWLDTTRDYGIDIFLTVSALMGDFRVGQTQLGAKVHKPSAPKLGPMFTQVITTLFSALVEARESWDGHRDVQAIPSFDGIAVGQPQSLAVDYKAIVRTACHQYETNREALFGYLKPETFSAVDTMMSAGRMRMDADLWCTSVYDLLFSFETGPEDTRSAVVESLKPLFFARVASFYRETLELDHRDSEREILRQAEIFRDRRDLLVERKQETDEATKTQTSV